MTYAGHSAYKRIASRIDSKEMMLVKLLEGAVRCIQAARTGIETGDIKIKGENISRAVAIITELDCALDRDMGGSLVENLSNLYPYILNRLTLGNLRNDNRIMDEVETLMTTIRDGFAEAFRMSTSMASPNSFPSYESQKGFRVAA